MRALLGEATITNRWSASADMALRRAVVFHVVNGDAAAIEVRAARSSEARKIERTGDLGGLPTR